MLRKSTAWSSNNKGLTKTDMSVIVLTSAPLCTPTCARWSQTCTNHMHIGKKNKKTTTRFKKQAQPRTSNGFPGLVRPHRLCRAHRHMQTPTHENMKPLHTHTFTKYGILSLDTFTVGNKSTESHFIYMQIDTHKSTHTRAHSCLTCMCVRLCAHV